MVTGKRFDRTDMEQQARLKKMADMFAGFGIHSFLLILSLVLWPKMLRNYDPFWRRNEKFFKEMYSWFEEVYDEHEKTYDPNHMRDYTDVFLRERRRAKEERDVNSSFYGDVGHWNYLNSMFDLFLVGSEATSTSLVHFILYVVHFPSLQKKLQDEIDSIIGRDRTPEWDDKENMPYTEAFLTELQRHCTIAPFSVPHAALRDASYRGFDFPKNTAFIINQYEVLRDGQHFPDPDRFDPERFLEHGKFKSHPSMIAFGVGKRECLGKSFAKMQMFLFATCLLQQFSFEPGYQGLPDLDDGFVGVTRSPPKFKVRVVQRK